MFVKLTCLQEIDFGSSFERFQVLSNLFLACLLYFLRNIEVNVRFRLGKGEGGGGEKGVG